MKKNQTIKQIVLTAVAVFGFGVCAMAQDTMDWYGNDEGTGTKHPTWEINDFPLNCYGKLYAYPTLCPPIYSDELKIVFGTISSICAVSGDTIFVQGIYQPATNEYPEDAPTSVYGGGYNGSFSFEIHYSDSSMNAYTYNERCLSDKQCQDINLQITCESNFATGKHGVTPCAEMWVGNTVINTNDTLGAYGVTQIHSLATFGQHDHGEGTVTISWTGFDGTPRQHVLYFIIDDHFYIDYVGYGVEENEDVSANGLRVYPNPAEDKVMLEAGETVLSVEVYNSLGQRVLRDSRGGNSLYVGSLANGLYILKAKTPAGTKYGKLIKK